MIDKKQTSNDLKAAVNSAAMSEHLVRVGRLKQLQRDRSWSDAELARQCGRTPQQVQAWYSFPNGGRRIGEKLARSLEEKLGLPAYWLDGRGRDYAPPDPSTLQVRDTESGYAGKESFAPGRSVESPTTPEGTAVPIVQWRDLELQLHSENSTFPETSPTLKTFIGVTNLAKFIEMPDDSMAPDFNPGDHILFEPVEAPRAGDTVLVRIPSGEHFVRTFRPRTAHAWEATPLNANYDPVSSATDGAEVVAVMIEHRRYRRRR